MITYAIKVEERMKENNPQFKGTPEVHYYYVGKNGWMVGQSLYEGYKTSKGARIGLAAYKKQSDFYKDRWSRFWTETIIGVVPMDGTEELTEEVA